VSTNEGLQIAQRTKTFHLITTIEHEGEVNVNAVKIAKPPHLITPSVFAIASIQFAEDIDQYISNLDTNYTCNVKTIKNICNNVEYKNLILQKM